MKTPHFKIPLDYLPASKHERHAILRDYFCDKDAKVVRHDDGWELTLGWSDESERYVDPRLNEGLAWWGNDILSDMPFEQRRKGRVLSALYDTWTIHSWSTWLSKQKLSATNSVVILHVDDHKDLGSPRLFMRKNGLYDPISEKYVNLYEPSSVSKAILSGALGMGSFMTPFLHTIPSAHVRHLCQPPKATQTLDYRIELCSEYDSLLNRKARRPSIQLEELNGNIGRGCYRITPDVNEWIKDLRNDPILVHIDMDYFCNRFDGDSDWLSNPNRLDTSLNEVFNKIDEVTSAINSLANYIEDVVIAFSPGFFPAEFWEPAYDRLSMRLRGLFENANQKA